MKKKFLALFVSVVMVMGVIGCGSGREYRASDQSEYIKLGQYTGFEIEMDLEVTDEEIQEQIDIMLESAAEYQQLTEGEVVSGSAVNIDFTGVMDGETEAFEGGSDKDYYLEVGSHSMIGDFEEQLIGHSPGETVSVAAAFPEDYGVEDLDGRLANFEVTINYIYGEKVIPEWNDEFVREYTDGSHTTTADYEKYLREDFAESKKLAAEENKQAEVMRKILENATVYKYDQEEVDENYNDCVEYYTTIANSYYNCELGEFTQNMWGKDEEQFKSEVADKAYQYVVGNIALLAIAYDQGISITEKEYEERLKELAEDYGYDSPEELEEECADYGENYLWDKFLKNKAMNYVLGTVIEI